MNIEKLANIANMQY